MPWIIKGLLMIGIASGLVLSMLTPLGEFLESTLTLHMIAQHFVFAVAGFLFSYGIDSLILVGSRLSKKVSHAYAFLLRVNSTVSRRGIVAFVVAAVFTAYWHIPENFNTAVLNEGAHIEMHFTFLVVGSLIFVGSKLLTKRMRHIAPIIVGKAMGLYGAFLLFTPSYVYSVYPLGEQSEAGLVMVAAMWVAAGFGAPIAAILVTAAAGFFSAGGAGAINCYIDRELDKHMTRTRNRPIPSGRISANRILTLGLALSFAGIGLAVVYLNYLTAFFIGMGIFWYIFVYTLWLKPRTKWNIVIGGAAGCFSALAGWSAVTGAVSLEGLLVAALIFLWTPGHFWGLAIAKTKDYSEVEVPMLPVVEGISRASFYTALSNALLFPFTIALFLLTVNWSNAVAAVVVGAILAAINIRFLIANIRLARVPDQFKAWKVFKLSAQYLFFVLVLIVIGHII